MSDQVMPTNSAGSGEQPMVARPEGLQAVPPAEAAPANAAPAGPEVAPVPGGGPAPLPGGQPAAGAAPAKLSADAVAAAIAAVPGGPPPPSPGPGGAVVTPATAGDVDVIEPEWVNKAEDVVKTHQGDPYGEEEGIEQLQEDYLQKRYGISVKDSDDAGGGTAGKPEGA